MKKFTTFIALALIGMMLNAQNTYVPDDNFEQKLIDFGYDDVLDNYVLTANISGVTYLNVGNSSISDLTGVEAFVSLTQLWCHNNDLTSLDVSNNTALTDLVCANNPLTALDVSANTALTRLWCGNNNFTTLDVSANTALTSFWCYNCGLTTLDVSDNTALTDLNVWGNSFTELDVSVNTALTSFACSSNQLTSLDVSNNTGLITLQCFDNQLTNLNVANGNNVNITTMQAENNPNLTCIQHDTGFNPNAQSGWTKDTSSGWSTDCANYTACTTAVNILDNNFRNALLAHGTTIAGTGNYGDEVGVIDTNGDGIICQNEAQAYTGLINIDGLNVSDITGIEEFINITGFWCHGNQMTSLDLSNNTALVDLDASNNQFTSLDLSNNVALIRLSCQNNQLTSLDVSNNTALTRLYCLNNQLNSLDLSDNTALIELYCYNNQLTSLDVSNNTSLTYLYCAANQLTSLDISNNTSLTFLECSNNSLTSLNVANGNNANFAEPYSNYGKAFDAGGNANLSCIQIDSDFTPPTTGNNQWVKDTTASWSTDCSPDTCTTAVNIPDDNFRNALLAHGTTITGLGISAIDTNGDGIICQDEAAAYTGAIAVSYLSITDLTGIEAFVNATELYCGINQITSLDVSNNTSLTTLITDGNPVTTLDVSNNTALTYLHCAFNPITELDVSNNTALEHLSCYNNQLVALDVSNNTALTELWCGGNELTALDVSNNTALTELWCEGNELTVLDASNNTTLTFLHCANNSLTSLNVANGNNANFVEWNDGYGKAFDASGNANLSCIQIDNGFTPPTTGNNQWVKDATASWSTDCSPDSDNDGIADIYDNCPTVANADQADMDNDGTGDVCDDDIDGDGVANEDDCNPNDASVGAATTWYADADNDGYGAANTTMESCTQPNGYVSNDTDCDDTDANIHPGATEIAGNGIDEDCDGSDAALPDSDNDGIADINDNCPTVANADQADMDNDGTGDVCDDDIDGDGIANDDDCNPTDASVGAASTWYADADNDGYGAANTTMESCTQPSGYVADNTDCDDTDATIHPGATEIANDGIDQDCNGSDLIDDGDCPTFTADDYSLIRTAYSSATLSVNTDQYPDMTYDIYVTYAGNETPTLLDINDHLHYDDVTLPLIVNGIPAGQDYDVYISPSCSSDQLPWEQLYLPLYCPTSVEYTLERTGNNSAVLDSDYNGANTTYDIYVTSAGNGAPTLVEINDHLHYDDVTLPLTVNGIPAGQDYDVYISPSCSSDQLPWEQLYLPLYCPTSVEYTLERTGNNSAVLDSDYNGANTTYDIYVTSAGNGAPTLVEINDHLHYDDVTLPLTVNGIPAGQDYDVYISPSCSSDQLPWDQLYLPLYNAAGVVVELYPNPVTDILYVKTAKEIRQLTVYDGFGRLVMSVKNSSQINVNALKAGKYMLEVVDESGNTEVEQFIVER